MRDVVVIGGGLSGLAACYELEKRGAAYTVIEVKRRFGGGIRSSVERGFIMDACAFAFRRPAPDVLPPEFELEASMLPLADDICLFRQGSETLVRAFACRLAGGRLMRMAVSSIGALRNRFSICLENGIMLDGGALILAVPAPFAARMLWNLAPDAARHLTAFRYDAVRRVSLGYHKGDLPARIDLSTDETFPFIIAVDQNERLPDHNHRPDSSRSALFRRLGAKGSHQAGLRSASAGARRPSPPASIIGRRRTCCAIMPALTATKYERCANCCRRA